MKNNFRVCISLSPTGIEFKDHLLALRQTILHECTVLWVHEFSKEALSDMAYRHFLNIFVDEERQRIIQEKEAKRS